MRGIVSWCSQVILWLVILVVGAVLVGAVLLPRLVGATPYAVLTGSMAPTHPPGTLVVVKPVEFDEIRVGDVITYQIESGKPAVATHRVVDRTINLNGDARLVTRGDANTAPDPEAVREEQVRGRVWYALPYVGHTNRLLTADRRQLLTTAVVVFLLMYAAYMFASAARSSSRRRTTITEEKGSAP